MSRRKQDNPQPRKRLLEPQPDHDLLTCGECQTDFPLSDILLFIEHKKHCMTPTDGHLEERLDLDRSRNATEKQRAPTPISVGIQVGPSDDQPTPEQKAPGGHKTESSEPKTYICTTCKQLFTSAWFLLQHAQNMHGMRIYLDASTGSSPSLLPPTVTPVSSSPLPVSSSNTITIGTGQPAQRIPLTPPTNSPFAMIRSPFQQREPLAEEVLRSPHAQIRSPMMGDQGGPEDKMRGHHPHHPHMIFPGIPPDRLEWERMKMEGRMPGLPEAFPRLGGPLGFAEQFGHHLQFGLDPTQADMGLPTYSQKLRQLAGTQQQGAGGGSGGGGSPPSSPKRKGGGFMRYMPFHPGFKPPFMGPGGNSGPGTPGGPRAQSPCKPKSCEFCGKSFKFQSNLVVHRRSHTGEKPFKCNMCDHACTQASKLKRHMKTHGKEGSGGLSSLEDDQSNASTPEPGSSSGMKSNMGSFLGNDHCDDFMAPNGEDGESNAESSESHETEGHEGSNQLKSGGHSMLGEVMEDIGLNAIHEYNEAYQAAMAEKAHLSRKPLGGESMPTDGHSTPDDCPDHEEEENMTNHSNDVPENSTSPPRGRREANMDVILSPLKETSVAVQQQTKRIKLEPGQDSPHGLDIYSQWLAAHAAPKDILFGSTAIPSPMHENGGADFGGLNPHHDSDGGTSSVKSDTSSVQTPSTPNTPGRPPKEGKSRKDTCEFCGKQFKNCSNLTVHRRSHTGEKPYKCEMCSYACAQSSKLTRHMKTHGRAGKEVYKCEICEMPFSVYGTMEKHMKKAHGITTSGSMGHAVSGGHATNSAHSNSTINLGPQSENVEPKWLVKNEDVEPSNGS
ncbi:PREDICTED: B-cell lymphoma/leukemia 11A-like [Branchiostoma belcheri]|uniref:B-cell lymphoma/leukemia 11A-like n=1 Tax=Branchiostoma belcheri TaxID=7741 RepID=A0A6P4YFH8_BRABE|nr:PREDICTED: B-cell lymphoma/leukemia 11A-like [Branchiostoma belcheri]